MNSRTKKGLLLLAAGWLIGLGIHSCRKQIEAEKELNRKPPEWLETKPIQK